MTKKINDNPKPDKFKLALDHAPVAVFIMDKNWNFEYINPEFERISGYSHDELLHKNTGDTLYKNLNGGIPESRREIISFLNEGKSWKGELLTFNKNGTNYWAETTASPYKNELGEIEGYIVIQNDVTEKKNLEKFIVESEDKYRTLVEYSQDGIAIVQDGRFKFVNNAMTKILGYTPQEFYDIKGQDVLHPDSYDKIWNIHKKRMDGEISSINYSMQLIAKDGRVVDVEAQSSTFEYDGKPAGYLTIHDVTESRRMQEALQKSERRFRELTEMLPQAIYELDTNNHPKFMNRAGLKMFGLTPGVSQNKKAFEFFSSEDSQKMKEALDRESKNIRYENGVLQPFASEPNEYIANRADGSTFPVIVYGTPIVEDGVVTGSRGIIIDISERKAMENALRESERKYKALVESSLDGIMIVRNNRILFANDTYCKMLGYDPQFIAKSLATDFIVEEEQERALELSKRRVSGDYSTIRECYTLRRSDGKIIVCEAYSSIIDYEGEIASFFTIHDVTENRRMQRAIEEKEMLYRTLIEKTQDGVVLTSYRDFYLVNQAFCDIFGYTRDEIMSMNPTDLLAAEHKERVLLMHDKRMSGEIDDSTSYVATLIHKNGNRLAVEINSSTVKIEGQILSFVTLRDITKRNQLQEELERSEQKYRQLTEMLPQTIYELDMFGNITYMNQTGFEKFGITSSDLGTSAFNFIIPEQHEMMRINMIRSLTENYSTPGNSYTAVRKNGETFPAMIFASPLKGKEGITGTRGIILDMSEHIAMQNALYESEEKYRSLIEKATDGIVITQDGKLKFSNEAMHEMMQYSEEEMLNHPFHEFVIPEDHEEMIRYHERRMSGEKFNVLYRSHFIRKDRKIITVELNARTLYFMGKPAAFIVIRDITERLIIEDELKMAKAELEELNKNLEERIKESSDNLTEARTQLIRLQKENLQSQFEVLRQQVNPHFLFNSLNVLTSLIKLEPDLAEKFTEHLSKVYRYVLENKDNDLVDLKTELDFLDAYLFLLNIRFMDKIKVCNQIEKDKTDLLILPLALQLLIENAIKHNSMSKKNPLCIRIFIDSDNFLNVVNNLQERESYIASTGVGLKNIEHRYRLLEMQSPEFVKNDNEFIARIPLKEVNN